MHTDAVQSGDRVLLVDDLLATGGTMQACVRLAERVQRVAVTVVLGKLVIERRQLFARQ